MPNISFDIFFDQDFINVSASRGKHAPKAKPEWKVRTAPKLPPKEQPEDPTKTPRPTPRPPINSTRPPAKLGLKDNNRVTELSDAGSAAGDKQKRKPPKLGPKKNPATDDMATSWVLGKVTAALQPTVNGAVSTAGSFAGGALNAVGSTVNGVGDSISGSIKRYGDGAKDYGNGVMDWTNATGSRATTAANPLGLGAGKTGGKRAVTSPNIYAAPKPSTPKPTVAVQPQKKVGAAPVKKALPAPASKPAAKPAGAVKGVTGAPKGVTGAAKKPAGAVTGVPKGVTGGPKGVTGAVRKPAGTVTRAPKPKPNYVGSANPLGLKT